MSEEKLVRIISHIHSKVPFDVELGIVCGSGLSEITKQIANPIVLPYTSIPDFPHSDVPGHANELVFGTLNGKKVIAMRGRFHFYEGWSFKDVVIGVKVMAALGCKCIIVTNAAGGLDKSFKVGDVMLIDGHISFVGMAGNNPLVGANEELFGPRFPSVSSAYDEDFGKLFTECHEKVRQEQKHDHELRKGCYVGVCGPNYESRHEIQMMRTMGGHAVGMSTVLEVIQAAHCGVKVLGLSLITNACLGTFPDEYNLEEPNHEEVTRETQKVSGFVQSVVAEFVGKVDLAQRPAPAVAAKFQRGNLPKIPFRLSQGVKDNLKVAAWSFVSSALVFAICKFGFKCEKKCDKKQ